MHESVRGGAVERQLGADADTDDHEAELVVERIGQDLAKVILDHGEEDREGRHHGADIDQDLRPGITPRQGIDRQLGGEGGKHDRAGNGRLGIGVLQPVVQEGEGAFDAEGEEDQETAQRVHREALVKRPAAGIGGVDHRTGQHHELGSRVHQPKGKYRSRRLDCKPHGRSPHSRWLWP